MVTVKRANVILTIEDDEVDKYYEKGYSVLDQNGNVIKAGAPTEVGALQKLLQEKDSEIAQLKKTIEKLKAENKVFVQAVSDTTEENSEPTEEPKKKSTYKRKTQ